MSDIDSTTLASQEQGHDDESLEFMFEEESDEEEVQDVEEQGSSSGQFKDITDQIERKQDSTKGFRPALPFDESKCGPQNFDPLASEREIFLTLWTQEQIDLEVKMTNAYAEQRSRRNWKVLEEKEYLAFLGCLLYMGLKKVTRARGFDFPPHRG